MSELFTVGQGVEILRRGQMVATPKRVSGTVIKITKTQITVENHKSGELIRFRQSDRCEVASGNRGWLLCTPQAVVEIAQPTEEPKTPLTEKQTEMMWAIYNDEYNDRGIEGCPWSWSVCGDKSRASVLGSLVKKGLVATWGSGNDAVCAYTDEGKVVMAALVAADAPQAPEQGVPVEEVVEERSDYVVVVDITTDKVVGVTKSEQFRNLSPDRYFQYKVSMAADINEARRRGLEIHEQTRRAWEAETARVQALSNEDYIAEVTVAQEQMREQLARLEDADRLRSLQAAQTAEQAGYEACKKGWQEQGKLPQPSRRQQLFYAQTWQAFLAGWSRYNKERRAQDRKWERDETQPSLMSSADMDIYWTMNGGGSDDEDQIELPPGKHLVQRARYKTRQYSTRGCLKCKASADQQLVYLVSGGFYSRKGTSRSYSDWVDCRYHIKDTCTRCQSVRCFPWEGEKPDGWKDTADPKSRDRQRDKVYRWQNKDVCRNPDWEFLKAKMSWEECRLYVKHLFNIFNLPTPKVRKGKGGTSWMRGTMEMSLVDNWGFCKWVMIHEAAHGISNHIQSGERHGPLFCAVYAILLQREIAPGSPLAHALKTAMEQDGLKVADIHETEVKLIDLAVRHGAGHAMVATGGAV